ncbi:MAG TPA: PepSY-associated TM helix domain-containing protein [Roseomonas sp.]|nr:PepSY-associated TM helix domain-containing protein [Roseomonas sp.]
MKDGLRQSMAWLHTWSGLLVGWVLYAVFLTGTAAYLRPEISVWMRPEMPVSAPAPQDAEVALAAMAAMAPEAPVWFITLPDRREPAIRAFWRDPSAGGRGFREVVLDPATGEPVTARDTRGGEFFYRFHFQLHYLGVLWGRWIISICTMFMLVAIISGVITHRRIFADFFTFRPGKGQRSWLDAHNLCAVLALPYHLMITYTGLVLLMLITMPWGIERAYPGQRAAFNAEVFGTAPPRPRSGEKASLTAVEPLLEEARREWQGGRPGRIFVTNPGDAAATIQLVRAGDERISHTSQSITFDGTTGAVLATRGEGGAAAESWGVMYGLHIGRFAGPLLRGLFVLAGLAGTAMVATGCLLWAAKRRQQATQKGAPGFGTRLVEHLNVAAIAGLPVAMVAFLWANRLLPVAMASRAEWEVHVFFIAWAACLAHPLLRRGRRSWAEQFAAGAAGFALLPLLDALLTGRHLGTSLAAGDGVRAGFDLGLLGCATLLGLLAWKVGRQRVAAPGRMVRSPSGAGNPRETAP